MSDWTVLREKARDAIRTGRLPRRSADRMWGGPGVGSECAICRAPIERNQMEYELEFAHGKDGLELEKYRAHIRCVAAWECEREALELALDVAAAYDDDVAADSLASAAESAATLRAKASVNGFHVDLPDSANGGKLSGHDRGGTGKG